MAEVIKTVIDVELNTGQFSSELRALQQQINAFNLTLNKSQAVQGQASKLWADNLAQVINRTGYFKAELTKIQTSAAALDSTLKKGQATLGQFFSAAFNKRGAMAAEVFALASERARTMQTQFIATGKAAKGMQEVLAIRPLTAFSSEISIASQRMQILGSMFKQGTTQLINFGKNVQWAGRQLMVGFTVPLTIFGTTAGRVFMDLEKQVVSFKKVYGDLFTTPAELNANLEAVKGLAAEYTKYGIAVKDTVALAAQAAAAGRQNGELTDAVRESTRLATLGQMDQNSALETTIALQSAFKLSGQDLSDTINFLNMVENQTVVSLQDIAAAIPRVAPVVQGLGGDVKDLTVFLAAMQEGGVTAEQGANALKSGLASLINPTKVAKEMFAGFGISLTDIVQRNAGDTTKTILALQSALDTLNPLQKQQALEQLFGKFQFARMNALFENLGKQGSQTIQVMDLMNASASDLANIAGRELTMVTESASGKYRRALEGLKADLAGVGEQFLNINTYLINLVDGVLKFVNKLPGPIKTILSLFGGFTAVAGPLIMLTGVLGNFFGYIIKGASHFRALFKGGEGWKLLTPEILAANKAGSIAETTFYSDAKAADILNQAITRLSASYTKLASDANNAIIATNPGVSTVAGTPLMLNRAERITDPSNPNVGDIGTRAAAHGRPVGLMTTAEKSAQTIHSVTPNPIPVNRAIGKNPQIFTYQDMPNIPGLTNVGGVSTGIVAGEAAKWHSLIATLSMQTKQETALLNREIQRTGLVSQEFLSTYSAILPQMTNVIDNAVLESQAIVRQTLAGKMRVEQAQAEIIRINAQLEAAMAQTTTMMAQQMGRTANLTQVPLTGQAIVDPRGKSNLREIFRADRTPKKILDAIAKATGVKTWGGGYSIETTKPKKFATGGSVVGGPRSDTTDTQFAYLKEGDFVLNRAASDNLLGFNSGGQVPAMVTPGEIVVHNPTQEEVDMLSAYNNQFAVGGKVTGSKNNYGIPMPRGRGRRPGASKGYETPQLRGTRDIRNAVTIGDTIIYTRGPNPAKAIENSIKNSTDPAKALELVKSYTSKLTTATHNRAETLQSKDLLPDSPLAIEWNKAGLGSLYTSGATTHATHATRARMARDGSRYVSRYTYQYDSYANQKLKTGIPVKDFISLNAKHKNKYDYLFKKAGVPSNLWPELEKTIDSRLYGMYGKSSKTISDDLPNTLTLEDSFAPIVDKAILESFGAQDLNRIRAKQVLQDLKKTDVLRKKGNISPISGHGASMVAGIRAAQQARYNKEDEDLLEAMYGTRRPFGTPQKLNRGGIVGGKVRRGKHNYGIQGLNTSGLGQPPLIQQMGLPFAGSGDLQIGESSTPQRSSLMSGMGMNIASMGAMMGGATLGGKYGGTLGSLAGSILAPTLLTSVLQKITAVNKAGASTAGIFGRLGPLMANPYVMAGAAVVGLTAGLLKLNSKIEETRRVNRLAFSGGVKPIKDFDSELKQVRKSIEDTKATSELLHAQMNSAGLSGLTLTIKEFSDLREKIKSTHPELIKLFNQTPTDKLSKVAEGLKAQFVAAGDSAAQANAKIAALLAETGKTGFIQVVLGSEGVKGIVNAKTAISSMLKSLEGFMTSKDKAAGILQIFGSMSDYIAKSNDKGAALKEQFDLIAKSGQANVQISQDQIVELSKTDPILASLLDRTDTIGKALAKWRLAVAGVNKELDGSEAQLMEYAIAAEGIKTYYDKLLDVSSVQAQSNKMTGQWAKDIDAFEKKQVNASKSAIKSLEKQIELKSKQIDQIKKEADARKKALRDQQQIEDVRLQIQQEQLNYQMALAAGDMSSAAQAQINIQRLVGQQQLKTAEDAIDSAAQAKIDALQAQIDALNKKSTAVSNAASTTSPAKSPLRSSYEQVQSVYKEYSLGNITEAEAATRLNDLVRKLEQTKDGQKYLKDLGVSGSVNNLVREDKETRKVPLDLTSGAGLELKNALNKGTDTLVKSAIDKSNTYLKEIRDFLNPDKDPMPASTGGGAGSRSGRPGPTDSTYSGSWAAYGDAVNKKPGRLYTPSGASRYIMDSAGNAVYEDLNPKEFKAIAKQYNTKLAMGGFIKKYAQAGRVVGPGTGTSDSIPAMLSNGEYVIRAASVQAVGTSFLDGINKMSAGGIATRYSIPRMSMGGRVNMSQAGQASTSNALYNINVTLNETGLTANDVANAIERKMRMVQAKEGLSRVY